MELARLGEVGVAGGLAAAAVDCGLAARGVMGADAVVVGVEL